MIHYDYATITQALHELRRAGYIIDFNLPENVKRFETGEYNSDDFTVTRVYRYEGESDPGDESIVYALESNQGIKGTLVSGFGISSNLSARKILNMLKQDMH